MWYPDKKECTELGPHTYGQWRKGSSFNKHWMWMFSSTRAKRSNLNLNLTFCPFKNSLKMSHWSNCKIQNLQAFRRKHRRKNLHKQISKKLSDLTPNAWCMKQETDQLDFGKVTKVCCAQLLWREWEETPRADRRRLPVTWLEKKVCIQHTSKAQNPAVRKQQTKGKLGWRLKQPRHQRTSGATSV